MENYFEKVKNFLLELEYSIVKEDSEENILIIEKQDEGITNMIVAVEPPIVIIEQALFDIPKDDVNIYKEILMKNRDLLHGAMVLDGDGKKVIYRDTLEVENLDLNELEASINSLSILLSEFGEKIIEFAKS